MTYALKNVKCNTIQSLVFLLFLVCFVVSEKYLSMHANYFALKKRYDQENVGESTHIRHQINTFCLLFYTQRKVCVCVARLFYFFRMKNVKSFIWHVRFCLMSSLFCCCFFLCLEFQNAITQKNDVNCNNKINSIYLHTQSNTHIFDFCNHLYKWATKF